MAMRTDLPAGLIAARSALKPFNLAQALRDIAAVLFCFSFGLAVVGSVPLAIVLLFLGSFN